MITSLVHAPGQTSAATRKPKRRKNVTVKKDSKHERKKTKKVKGKSIHKKTVKPKKKRAKHK